MTAPRACVVLTLIAGLTGCPQAGQRADTGAETGAGRALLGSWRADLKDRYQETVQEARIDHVDRDGNARGIGCETMRSGLVRGAVLDGNTRWGPVGGHLEAAFGKSRMTLIPKSDGTLLLVEKLYLKGGGRRTTIHTTLRPGHPMHCVKRFRTEPVPVRVERKSDDPALVGTWTGRWPSGDVFELAIETLDRESTPRGRWCWMVRHTDGAAVITLLDLHPDTPRVETSWAPADGRLTVERQATTRQTHRQELFATGPDEVRMEVTENAGIREEETYSLTLRRGTDPQGCLVRTTPRPQGRSLY